MNIADVAYIPEFLMLADTLNFSRAAAVLNISQPTLSRHISSLERQLGVPLFDRSTNSVKLTAEGRLLYQKASSMMSVLNCFADDLAKQSKQPARLLRVGGGVFLPPTNFIFNFLASKASLENKNVRLKYSKTRNVSNEPPVPYCLDALAENQLDLAVDVFPATALADMGHVHLFDERMCVFARQDNPLVQKRGLKLEDLRSQTLVTFAINRNCSAVYAEPFVGVGYAESRVKRVAVDGMLDIAREVADLAEDEIFALHESQAANLGVQFGMAPNIAVLDLVDDRCKSGYYLVFRKNEADLAVLDAVATIESIIDELKGCARPDDWADGSTLWSSILYMSHL